MNSVIVSNRIECLICGDKLCSVYRHDFVTCQCGAVSCDGGEAYLRRVGNPSHYKDISICMEKQQLDLFIEEIQLALDRHCNARGLVYTAMRFCRDNDLLGLILHA
jgi:hypothetical protein